MADKESLLHRLTEIMTKKKRKDGYTANQLFNKLKPAYPFFYHSKVKIVYNLKNVDIMQDKTTIIFGKCTGTSCEGKLKFQMADEKEAKEFLSRYPDEFAE